MLHVPSYILVPIVAIFVSMYSVAALNNGLALTPQMGWNSWNHFACKGLNEQVARAQADAMISSGLYDVGYNFFNLDDCWAAYNRTPEGKVIGDPIKFPSGIKALADYVHSKKLKFGIYSDAGSRTCSNHDPGSLHHEQDDANTFASWGVDYLKYDNCFNKHIEARKRYPPMRDALNSTLRPIFFSMCEWGRDDVATWGMETGNSWRTTQDIKDHWRDVIRIIKQNDKVASYAGPGGWNDPDMLEVGNGGMTTTEYISHFSLWALMKAPLIIGCDMSNMTSETKTILTNTEVIAVNQDKLGVQGYHIANYTDVTEIWAGPLFNGDIAVILFNRAETAQQIQLNWSVIKLKPTQPARLRDLWLHSNLGTFTGSYSTTVPRHGVVFLRVKPLSQSLHSRNELIANLKHYQTARFNQI